MKCSPVAFKYCGGECESKRLRTNVLNPTYEYQYNEHYENCSQNLLKIKFNSVFVSMR